MTRVFEAIRQVNDNGRRIFGADTSTNEQARFTLATVFQILATAACYYVATRLAWMVTFPDSKVSLFFPPHAVLVSILLLVPSRHWWAYTLAAAGSHYFATQQAHWPPLYALQCEAFDAVKYLLTAGAIRAFIRPRFHLIGLREAVAFVAIAVIGVPLTTAFWGAAFTVSNGYGTRYWIEWRNLSVSNGVTSIILVPTILIGVHQLFSRTRRLRPARIAEAFSLLVSVLIIGYIAFYQSPVGPDTSPALLYAPIPLLIWAALRFGVGGISASMLVITILAITGTMRGRGPFLTQTPSENATALQLFLLMAATPLFLLAAAIDDERRSKEAVRVSEERMSLAAESAQLAMWEWDVGSDTIFMSAEGRKFLGLELAHPIRFADLNRSVHPDDRAMREAAIQRALDTHSFYEMEYRLIRPDGSVRWMAARGRHGPAAANAPQRILGVSMDITRQKEAALEAQLQREELVHLSRVATVSALSNSLAHELRQPLGSILSNAQTAQMFMSQDVPNLVELRSILSDIVSADRRAGAIIEGLRTMLRRGEVTIEPVNVNENLEELLRLTSSDLIAGGVSVSKVVTDDNALARTDRVQLQQVLLNLIMNARDAMESNAPEDRSLTLTTSVTENEVQIGVLDCGVGLPDDVESLFQPFHSTKASGLGMGLSICRSLVASHGGRLWAERRADRGAAFYVALPLATQDVQEYRVDAV